MSPIKKFAILGDPITHSKSPQIHQTFANQFNLKITYEKCKVTPNTLEKTLKKLQENNYTGVNLTSPLKELALQFVDTLSEPAKQAQAINTITFQSNGKRIGDNTDGDGLQRDFLHHNIPLKNKKILILGAGGAVRGILPALLAQTPSKLFIYNRTHAKAETLAANFLGIQPLLAPEINDYHFDICINALSVHSTSLNFKNRPPKIYYDLKYQSEGLIDEFTPEIQLNGIGMLIEQAAQAFYIWHRFQPDTKGIRNLLACYT